MFQYVLSLVTLLTLLACSKPVNEVLSSDNSTEKTNEETVVQSKIPTRGVCLLMPHNDFERFLSFVENELVPRKVNLLVPRIDYKYEWESHPELAGGLSKTNALRLKALCDKHGIQLVPLFMCLGHQSWGTNYNALLKAYPDFEEDPGDKINDKDFYCRSYCPRHPDLHNVIFDLFDELIDVFDPEAIHVGMDEVFILGEDSCKNGCAGEDKAVLFAEEVNRLNDYLNSKEVDMWMWGDRLIDGNATGLGKWQAAINGTHPAIDMISKDITICDWHYISITTTAEMFAKKGFQVLSCPYKDNDVALAQLADMEKAQDSTDPAFKGKMMGMLHTVWMNPSDYMNAFQGDTTNQKAVEIKNTFIELAEQW